MNVSEEVKNILIRVGAVIEHDHFVGTSGRHMSVYVNKDYLLPHPAETFAIAEFLAAQNQDLDIEVVAAPVVGAVILGQLTAYHLSRSTGREILSVYADKTDAGPLIFKRGYDALVKGKKVLIIDDTVATGLSVRKMIDAVREFGGEVQAMSVIVNRVPAEINTQTLGVRFSALCDIPAETYPAEACPLCAKGLPVNTSIGHGKQFLEQRSKA